MRQRIRSGTLFCSLSYFTSRLGFGKLKYLYPVISVIVDSLPANTKIGGIDKFVDGQSAISRILGGLYKLDSAKYARAFQPNPTLP